MIEHFFAEVEEVVKHDGDYDAPNCPTCRRQVKVRLTGPRSPWVSCDCAPDPHAEVSA